MAKKKKPAIHEPDAKQRIIEAASYLFGMKGYDGTSTREIAARAGVNIAALNYYFRSKNNLLLEVMEFVINSFRERVKNIARDEQLNTAEFAVRIYDTISEDGSKLLNQFKLVMDMEHFPDDKLEPEPIGFEQIGFYLNKELNSSVPGDERLWACQVIFGFINHIALLSVCEMGQKFIKRYSLTTPRQSIQKLVNALICDLNVRFA